MASMGGIDTSPNRPFSTATRRENIERLAQEEFDLLIIGGGITGVAVARDASLRGFHTALVEKGDFGSGTSSRSTRLIHGGIRYLEYGEFKLYLTRVQIELFQRAENAG
jgi:glycerol-3-phosphate dehydrogenase